MKHAALISLTRISTVAVAIAGCSDGGTASSILDVPLTHRAAAATCDNVRSDVAPNVPADAPQASCTSHDNCTAGDNGRCVGNSHDGWYCTYDECFEDADCAGFVCECGGGFRADNNVCLREGNCLTDSDCGPGATCSPTLGDCGNYSGVVGYYCHTAADECVDDRDCVPAGVDGGGGYCAYNKVAGKWMCSTQQCAG